MLFLVGLGVVIGCVVGGYVMHHGKLGVLWQPNEFIIILGAAFGSFLIANPMKLVKDVAKSFKYLLKGSPFKKEHYIELLVMLYGVFKLMKSKGMLEIESHIEDPHQSALFSKYNKFVHNHHAVTFMCDYLRMMTMGMEDYYQLEERMTQDLDVHHHSTHEIASAVVNVGDSMPALGIVAAVLGVITTMGSIKEPPEVLGGLIGAALVGTFFGVLVSYGLLAPIGKFIGTYFADEAVYLECIKIGMLAHVKGNAPVISIEFARNTIPEHERPSFKEVEEAINSAPPA